MNSTRQAPFDLTGVEVVARPFPHFAQEKLLEADAADGLLEWLQSCRHWKRYHDNAYDLDIFNALRHSPPGELSRLVSPEALTWLRHSIGRVFDAAVGGPVCVDALRMQASQRVRIHTDFGDGLATHRLIVYVGAPWDQEKGGLLLFFERPEMSALRIGVPPQHGAGVAFAISRDSYHAVSPVYEGTRYALRYSFHRA